MNRTSSESALTAYSEDVYRRKKASRSSNDATHHHMEDIMVHSTLIQRCGKVDSSGQPCLKTQKTSSKDVEHVRGIGISIQEMPCHSPTTSRSSSSMSGVLTTWDHFKNWWTMSTSWWQLTMSLNGAMPCRAADAKNSKKMFEDIIFPRFGVSRMVISDGCTHFTDKNFHKYLLRHEIWHNVATPYHP